MTKKRKLPSPRVLRRLLDYDPETGELKWKERPVWMFPSGSAGRSGHASTWNKKNAGNVAFPSVGNHGYKVGSVLGISMTAHRMVWALHHGEWPSHQIDHINHVRSDNRIINLRVVTQSENGRNMTRSKRNKSGVTGVFWVEERQKWLARIKNKHVGIFTNKSDAIAARKAAEKKYGFHPNHGCE